MPITKSAKKAVRQSTRKKSMNKTRKNRVKSLKKQIHALVKTQKTKEALALAPQFSKAVDKAAKARTIAKNKASREKARIDALMKKSS